MASKDSRALLEKILGAPPESPPPSAPAMEPLERAAAGEEPTQRLTVTLPVAVIERARSAVYYTPGLTLVRLATEALTREVERLERERGEPFPTQHGPMRIGRPIRVG